MAWHKVLLALLISFLFSPLQTQASEQKKSKKKGDNIVDADYKVEDEGDKE